MNSTIDTPGVADLRARAHALIAMAEPGEQIEVVLSRGASTGIRVHGGEVESLTSADSSGAGIRVVSEGRLGFAHCGTLDDEVLEATLAEARDNARFGEPDEFNGIAEPDGVPVVPRDAWNQAVLDLPMEERIGMALDLERRVLAADPRIVGTRVTRYGDGWAENVLVSTEGIDSADRASSCSISTQVLSRDGQETQTGFAHDAARDPADLDLDEVVAEAADRATRLLGARKPSSGRMSIILEPRLAVTLLGIVAGMLAGDSVLKGRSPFGDRVGERIASPLLTLTDDPTRIESLGSEQTDGEGLACRPTPLIVRGELEQFLRDSTTARRMGTTSTASAVRGVRSLPRVGAQVLVMAPGHDDLDSLIGSTARGLYVSSFSGLHSGVNPVSGDFSVGADGLMVRDGSIAEPVRELTIASTIQRLLSDIVAVGQGEWLTSGHYGCSLVIDDVAISGA